MKLYKVTLVGLHYGNGIEWGTSFVVAEHPTEAYEKVRKYLDENDIGFEKERHFNCIEEIASNDEFHDGLYLFL